MKTEAQVCELLAKVYRDIGGDPSELLQIAPLYGSWHTAIKFEVVKADNTRAVVSRQDIEDDNSDALKDALRAFGPSITKAKRHRRR